MSETAIEETTEERVQAKEAQARGPLREQEFEVTEREVGRHASRALRAAKGVPAVLYGHGEPLAVALAEREARTIRALPANAVFTLALPKGPRESVRLVAIQHDPLTGHLLHVDFERVVRGEKIRAEVPIEVAGEAELSKRGGIVEFLVSRIEVEGDPRELPSAAVVDVSNLGIGAQVTAGEVPLPAGVLIHGAPEMPVLTITHAQEEAVGSASLETPAPETPSGTP